MRPFPRCVPVLALFLAVALPFAAADDGPEGVPTPESVFGFSPGADRKLIDYEQLVDYVESAAGASPRVEVREIGASTLGRPMVLVFISSEENIARLDELREINRRLALDAELSDGERARLVEQGRVFVMASLSMHSTEVAPAQSLPVLTHWLATATDAETLGWLDDVVVMAVACENPDGMDMVVEHYRENLGTPYEGGSMPGLYHHYVGHDNNRDFLALNLSESRAVSRVYSTEWYPHVLIDKHQMGRTGPRYFVPRYHDPIAEVIDGKVWSWVDLIGSSMAREMGESGLSGVASHWIFDDYWPGSTTTSNWKNVISLLTEAAGVRVATPVFVEKAERRVGGKGLSEYAKSVNMLDPWPGGWWHLSDIVAYELASWRGVLGVASRMHQEILDFRNEICREEVERGRSQPPYYYVIRAEQHDAGERDHLVALLIEHGIEVSELTADTEAGGDRFSAGDLVVATAQPYRPMVKEALEVQHYPIRHYTPGGEIIRPYDITSWSLPLHLGVDVVEVNTRSTELEARLEPHVPESRPAVGGAWGIAVDARDNASYRAAFLALSGGAKVVRTAQPLVVGGNEIGAGSFLIPDPGDEVLALAGSAHWTALDERPETAVEVLRTPRIALVETWFHHMDAGWTRFLLESYGIPYTLLRPGEVAGTDLAKNFDVVIFPDADEDVLLKGKFKRGDEYRVNDYRPEFRKGLGEDGMKRITAFVEAGGRVLAWGGSVGLFTGEMTFGEGDDALELELPVRDDGPGLKEDGLYVPGSLLRVELRPDQPLTWGMPAETGVFSRGRPVLGTDPPMLISDRRVIGSFPEKDVLLSGYAEGVDLLAGRPAMVWVRAGRGQLVLFGFGPQFRASVPATYKLLFNAILLPEVPAEQSGVAGVTN